MEQLQTVISKKDLAKRIYISLCLDFNIEDIPENVDAETFKFHFV